MTVLFGNGNLELLHICNCWDGQYPRPNIGTRPLALSAFVCFVFLKAAFSFTLSSFWLKCPKRQALGLYWLIPTKPLDICKGFHFNYHQYLFNEPNMIELF